jgi:hypothetical protein
MRCDYVNVQFTTQWSWRMTMTRKSREPTQYRYELVHGEDADFIAYQRLLGGVWQTFSTWMVPRSAC